MDDLLYKCILGYFGACRIHLVWPSNSGNEGCTLSFEGVFELGQACRLKYDVIGQQMRLFEGRSP